MNKNLFLRLLLVIAIFVVALYYSLSKPIKLGLDLKGGAYVVLEAVKDQNKNGAIEKRKVVDKVAASIILQTYLDMKKLKFLEEGKE